jgi:FkbM family methyltransferase
MDPPPPRKTAFHDAMTMRATIRRQLARMGRALGYTIIPNWALRYFPQSTYLRNLFRLLGTDCVIDVGANRGQYRDFLRNEVGYRSRILSFEPIPELAAAMANRARSDPCWTIERCALGSFARNAELNVMASTTFSSLLVPRSSETRFAAANTPDRRIPVEISTLDDFLPTIDRFAPRSIYLKLDTQGSDLEVLGGACRVIARVDALQTEASVRPLYENAPTFASTMAAVEACGFVPSAIFPNDDGHFPELYEFDFHAIRRDSVAASRAHARSGSPGDPRLR